MYKFYFLWGVHKQLLLLKWVFVIAGSVAQSIKDLTAVVTLMRSRIAVNLKETKKVESWSAEG